MEERRFYVYTVIGPITWLLFYVGKGIGRRKFKHLKETKENTENYMKYHHIKGLRNKGFEPWVITYTDNLTNNEAKN